MSTLIALLLAAAAVLVGASPAFAHDTLVSSSPAAGSTVTGPLSTVSLTFDEAVLATGNGSTVLAVTGRGGRHFETACPVVRSDEVSAAVRLGAPGTYTITWRVVSGDGHPVSDSITFRYAPRDGAAAAAGSVSGPSCGDAAVRGGSGTAAQPSSTGSVVVLVAVVAGVLVLLVVAVVVLAVVLTRRRP